METKLSIKQGQSICILEEEKSFLVKVLENKGISLECFDFNQNILNLNKSYVGYIKTNKRMIEINPKYDSITINHIMRMYYFVYGVFKNFEDPLFDLSKNNNYINIIDMFIEELRIIKRRGLITEYVNKKEKSKYIRGNVDYINSYKNMKLHSSNPFINEIDELTIDNDINRILKKALNKVSKIRPQNTHLKDLKKLFNNISYCYTENKEFIFTSKNYYCKNAYFLAKLILEESYFDETGSSGGECFLINFDLLFENFVKKILLVASGDTRFIEWKHKQAYGVYNMNEKLYIPDILFNYSKRDNMCSAVIDVKNKFSNIFKNTDVFQMLFYCGNLNSKKAILCYPTEENKQIDMLEIYSENFITQKIYSVFINICSQTKEEFKDDILKFIDNIYECIES